MAGRVEGDEKNILGSVNGHDMAASAPKVPVVAEALGASGLSLDRRSWALIAANLWREKGLLKRF